MEDSLEARNDFPTSRRKLEEMFPTDEACRELLDKLRWGTGFQCPACKHTERWLTAEGQSVCRKCRKQTSITAGTIFEKTRTPLRTWFTAAWLMTARKRGVSAHGLQRLLKLGSYQTAWTMLHRYRRAMVRPDRGRLTGSVEVYETYIRQERAAKQGRGKPSNRRTPEGRVALAVEVRSGQPLKGRIRLAHLPDGRSQSLVEFMRENVACEARLYTDAWSRYSDLPDELYPQAAAIGCSPSLASDRTPAAHRVASQLKQWLLVVHFAAVRDRLQEYLDEFAFRFNRRSSHTKGQLFYRLLEYAVHTPPVTYEDITSGRRSRP